MQKWRTDTRFVICNAYACDDVDTPRNSHGYTTPPAGFTLASITDQTNITVVNEQRLASTAWSCLRRHMYFLSNAIRFRPVTNDCAGFALSLSIHIITGYFKQIQLRTGISGGDHRKTTDPLRLHKSRRKFRHLQDEYAPDFYSGGMSSSLVDQSSTIQSD